MIKKLTLDGDDISHAGRIDRVERNERGDRRNMV
jgi:hypothetical protein